MTKLNKTFKQLIALTLSLAIALTLLVGISPQAEASFDITADFECLNFLAAVRRLPDVPSTGPILASHVAGITELNTSGRQVRSLAGIEHFVALEALDVGFNQLITIDISNNPALQWLDVGVNRLTTLDVSNNSALTYLDVSFNQLTTLNVGSNPALTTLRVGVNRLTTLDVSNNPELEGLWVGENRLTTLDVSNNPELRNLWAAENQLTTMDVSSNLVLEGLEVSDNRLTTLDVSNNPALEMLDVSFNQLPMIDVSNNPALQWLDVGVNRLTMIDVSNNPDLEDLWVMGSQLTTIDVSNNPALINLIVTGNQLTTLDVSNNPELTRLQANNNQLTTLDVSNNPELMSLHLNNNRLTTLDLSANTNLWWIDVRHNYILSVDMIIGVGNTQLSASDAGSFWFTPQNIDTVPMRFAVTVVNGTSSTETAVAGATVTITANTPPSGQRFVNWTTTSAGVVFANTSSSSTTFIMSANAVTVTANFEDILPSNGWLPPLPVSELFADSQNHWAAGVRNPDDTNYIGWAMANDITTGFPNETFRPNSSVTRAQFTAFLYRIAEGGTPPVRPELGFADMRQGDWHHNYIAWAYSEDIVTGFSSNNTFRPNSPITREQLVLMLYRYTGEEGVATDVLSNFSDSYRTSSWAREAMNWAAHYELIGRGGTLNPDGNATRAETLAILYRAVETFNIPAP